MKSLSEIRAAAWKTRRERYGPTGTRLPYGRPKANREQMLALIIRLHNEGILSEGQVCKVTELDRVEIRRLALDDALDAGHPLRKHYGLPTQEPTP